jgi:hypothetical protein
MMRRTSLGSGLDLRHIDLSWRALVCRNRFQALLESALLLEECFRLMLHVTSQPLLPRGIRFRE